MQNRFLTGVASACELTASAVSGCAVSHRPSQPRRILQSTKALDKPVLILQSDFRCGIHDNLRRRGFPGCTAYDCFGAGQKVAQVTVAGEDWRSAPHTAKQMFEVFAIMRQLHELLWYLVEALSLQPAGSIHGELGVALDETERLTHRGPDSIMEVDVAAHRRDVNALLLRTSELVRGEARRHQIDRRGADLIGADLRGADLRGANLRGAYLIGADLRDADLRVADLIGADFRGADLRSADLSDSIFLTRSQLGGAGGDAGTKLPPWLTRPAHWSPARSSQSPNAAAPTSARNPGSTADPARHSPPAGKQRSHLHPRRDR